mgnify:CR=1 FL=1
MGKYLAHQEYKNSGVKWLGKIPGHWSLKKLKFICRVKTGDKDTVMAVEDGEYPFFVRSQIVERINSVGADCEAVLTAGDGVGVGKVFHYYDGKFDFHQRVYMLNDFSNVLGKFVYYYLSNNFYKVALEGNAKSTVDSLRLPQFLNFEFSLPEVNEQQKIANFLDHETAKIDTLIEKQQQLIKLLKEKRQAVISHAVTKGLNPNAPMRDSGVEWLGEVPEYWTVCRIKQVAKMESGHTPDKKKEEYWVNCDIPWVSLNDSSQLKEVDYISDTAFSLNEKGVENSSARKLPARCVVFTRDASIGLSAITTREMAVSQHIIAWVCDPDKVIPEYLLLVFYAMKNELERYAFGATLKTIGMPDVNKLTGAFPSLDEQCHIAESVFAKVKKFDMLVSKNEQVVNVVRERRTALISAAVTGKIDVRNWQAPATSEVEATK